MQPPRSAGGRIAFRSPVSQGAPRGVRCGADREPTARAQQSPCIAPARLRHDAGDHRHHGHEDRPRGASARTARQDQHREAARLEGPRFHRGDEAGEAAAVTRVSPPRRCAKLRPFLQQEQPDSGARPLSRGARLGRDGEPAPAVRTTAPASLKSAWRRGSAPPVDGGERIHRHASCPAFAAARNGFRSFPARALTRRTHEDHSSLDRSHPPRRAPSRRPRPIAGRVSLNHAAGTPAASTGPGTTSCAAGRARRSRWR